MKKEGKKTEAEEMKQRERGKEGGRRGDRCRQDGRRARRREMKRDRGGERRRERDLSEKTALAGGGDGEQKKRWRGETGQKWI